MFYFAILLIHRQVWFALYVRLLLHKGDVNNVWPNAIALYRDTDIVYRVPYRAVCIATHRCIDSALVSMFAFFVDLCCDYQSISKKCVITQTYSHVLVFGFQTESVFLYKRE